MATTIYAGFYEAFAAGDLEGSPDIRLGLGMSGFAFDVDDVNLADGTLDEYDGGNYARYDATGVAAAYDSTNDEWRLTVDDGDFGTSPVTAASDDIAALFIYLHVDGTAANDILLASTDSVAGQNGNGGNILFTAPDPLLFVRPAA